MSRLTILTDEEQNEFDLSYHLMQKHFVLA